MTAFESLCQWVSEGERRSFCVEYGYGIAEQPVVVLRDGETEIVRVVDQRGFAAAVDIAIESVRLVEADR